MKTVILDRQRDGCYSNVTDNNKYISRVIALLQVHVVRFSDHLRCSTSMSCREVSYLHQLYFTVLCIFFLLTNFGAPVKFFNPRTPPLLQTSCIYLQQSCNGSRGCNAIFQKFGWESRPQKALLVWKCASDV